MSNYHGLESLAPAAQAGLEAIIRMARPVFEIRNDAAMPLIEPLDPASADTVTGERDPSDRSNRTADQYAWAGTGWLSDSELGDGIVLTNAHVAEVFANHGRAGFVFRSGTVDVNRRQEARIDFREEKARVSAREFRITEMVYISEQYPLDVAILRSATQDSTVAQTTSSLTA